jgi:hypothetical protein
MLMDVAFVMQSLEMRRLHQPGQPFHDPTATLHQPQIVPPSLQLQPSAPTPTQAAVYDSFQVYSLPSMLQLCYTSAPF